MVREKTMIYSVYDEINYCHTDTSRLLWVCWKLWDDCWRGIFHKLDFPRDDLQISNGLGQDRQPHCRRKADK